MTPTLCFFPAEIQSAHALPKKSIRILQITSFNKKLKQFVTFTHTDLIHLSLQPNVVDYKFC